MNWEAGGKKGVAMLPEETTGSRISDRSCEAQGRPPSQSLFSACLDRAIDTNCIDLGQTPGLSSVFYVHFSMQNGS